MVSLVILNRKIIKKNLWMVFISSYMVPIKNIS